MKSAILVVCLSLPFLGGLSKQMQSANSNRLDVLSITTACSTLFIFNSNLAPRLEPHLVPSKDC